MGTLALIALGSNVGDRRAHLDRALAALAETPGVAIVAVSTYHETTPAGGPAGQGTFLNAAARLDTDLDPFALLRALLDIENRAGRVRTVRWGERPLDLDLLIYGCTSLLTPELTLPHPRLGVRRFVLAPLAEIAPTIVDMRSGLSVVQLLANLDRRPSYVAIDGPDDAFREAIFRQIVAELPSVGLAESGIAPGQGPDWLEVEDERSHTRLSPMLKAKVASLDAARWKQTLGEARWLVTDFRLTCRIISSLDPLAEAVDVGPQAKRYRTLGLLWVWSWLRDLESPIVGARFRDWLLPSTFVLALPGGRIQQYGLRDPVPRKTGDVVLIPETSNISGIVHETLAACAASRG